MAFLIRFFKAKIPQTLKKIIGQIIVFSWPNSSIERFCKHNIAIWKNHQSKKSSVILYDAFPVAQGILTISYFLNILASKSDSEFRPFSYNGIDNPWYRRIYASFGSGDEVITRLKNKTLKKKALELADVIFLKLKTKEDVFNIEVNGIKIGIDIYETYLRFCGQPTVNIDQPLHKTICEAVELVFFWQNFCDQNDVRAFVLSHPCYVHLNVPAKIAYQRNIPVFNAVPFALYKLTKPFQLFECFHNFRKMFAQLSSEEKTQAKQLAKRQIERRLSGEVGVDMAYSTKSGYVKSKTQSRALADSKKIKVLIASHCFYDSPYSYGELLFIDFYEWISFLGKIAEETDYDWYLKMHPDPFPGTDETMKTLLRKYPRIKMLPNETSHLQMVADGLDFVLTCYGSVGQEYPALGIQVINAGYNPREAYNFNWHPKSVDEYRKMLLNLKSLNLKIDMNELYEFYYMYYYYVYADDFIFFSHREVEKRAGGASGLTGNRAYDFFLDEFNIEKHELTKKKISDFIDSGADCLFSKGPEKL